MPLTDSEPAPPDPGRQRQASQADRPATPVAIGLSDTAFTQAATSRSVVWSPHQASSRGRTSHPAETDRDHGYCQVLVRSLIRAQLGLSLLCLAFALAITSSFPVLCELFPRLIGIRVLGLPLTLIVLGAGIFPVILAVGRFYTWQANRLEHQFIRLIGRVRGEDADDVRRRTL